ncbi:hypothetical protein L3X38_028416 [Prunus dulcis]|uniref:Uncharacterized protein n=1 Tax=Prunus dulcis TaxID=3755 RepID=A0AAD4Z1E9_PRUDU|nr:hypothetical protein L3X38_028416 [Prunus dulcis]
MEEAAGEDEVGFWVLAEICSSDGEDEVGGASSDCRKLCSCDFNEIELWLCKAMEEEIDEIESPTRYFSPPEDRGIGPVLDPYPGHILYVENTKFT